MKGKYNLVTLTPTISHLMHAASGGADVLWDWEPLEIPLGTCVVKHLSGIVMGIDGGVGNGNTFKMYFAKPINGVAPPTIGTVHAVTTAAFTAACRPHVFAHMFCILTSIDDGDAMIGYNVMGARSEDALEMGVMLQGDTVPYPGTTPGYQTIFVAAQTSGAAIDFGTEVDLDNTSNVAANMTGDSVQITTQGTDPQLVFAPGDLIQGHTGGPKMEVVSVDGTTTMTVKNISAQIDDNEHLIHQNPMVINFGLEY